MTQRAKREHKINGSTYLPCEWQDSLDAGARWYRLILHYNEYGVVDGAYDERCSPRFATLEDCRRDSLDYLDAQPGNYTTE